MFDTAMPLNGVAMLNGEACKYEWTPPTKPPTKPPMSKEELKKWCIVMGKHLMKRCGYSQKRTPESKYSLTFNYRLRDPNYCESYYEQDFTCYTSDPGKVVSRVVADGDDDGELSDEYLAYIERVTRWLIGGDGEITTCAGTFRKLKGEQK